MLRFRGSVAIPAPQGKVFDFFRRDLGKLPSFCPDLLEIEELRRQVESPPGELTYEETVSRWRARLRRGESSQEIYWVERESFIGNEVGSFYVPFSLTGDFDCGEPFFSAFQGTWEIAPHEEGTQVTILLECGFFSEEFETEFGDFLGELITQNVSGILKGLCSAIGGSAGVPLVIFEQCHTAEAFDLSDNFVFLLGHASDNEHLTEVLWRKGGGPQGLVSRDQAGKLCIFSRLFPTHLSEIFPERSGLTVALIGCPFVPGLDPPGLMRERTREAFELALRKMRESEGTCMLSLGGFTSIVTSPQMRDEYAKKGILSTTGSFFTAGSILRSIEEAASILGRQLKDCTAAILGAGGSIGSKLSVLLSRRLKEIRLTGRSTARLGQMASFFGLSNAKLFSDKENRRVVKGADFIVTVTSSAAPVISSDECEAGSCICDAGFPKNVRDLSPERGVFIYPGGLAVTSWPMEFSTYTGLPASEYGNRVIYGCWAEGIILGLEGMRERSALSFERDALEEIKLSGAAAVERWTERILTLGEKYGIIGAPVGRFIKNGGDLSE